MATNTLVATFLVTFFLLSCKSESQLKKKKASSPNDQSSSLVTETSNSEEQTNSPQNDFRAATTTSNHVRVGAIRWDFWFKGSKHVWSIQHSQFTERLPHYYYDASLNTEDKVDQAREGVMTQEISIANKYGIDFWAFTYYDETNIYDQPNPDFGGQQALQTFRGHSLSHLMSYGLILLESHMPSYILWDEDYSKKIANYVLDSNYLKTPDGRPMFWWFKVQQGEQTKVKLNLLRQSVKDLVGVDPYIVLMDFDPNTSQRSEYSFDALGSYASALGTGGNEVPYLNLRRKDLSFWESAAKNNHVVPTVTSGWDYRPIVMQQQYDASLDTFRDKNPSWATHASPAEVGDQVTTATKWVENSTNSPAKTVLIYAWNELAEGGFIMPTVKEGDARLFAIDSFRSETHNEILPQTVTLYEKYNQSNGDRLYTKDGQEAIDTYPIIGSMKVFSQSSPYFPLNEIFRCRHNESGMHFVSNSLNCEGHAYEGSLGYLLSTEFWRFSVKPVYRCFNGTSHRLTESCTKDESYKRLLGYVMVD